MTEREAQNRAAAPQPIRWRLALLTWFAAFLTALVVFIVGGPELSRMNVVLRALIVTGILVGVIQYVALPLIFRYGGPVLFRHSRPADVVRGTSEEAGAPPDPAARIGRHLPASPSPVAGGRTGGADQEVLAARASWRISSRPAWRPAPRRRSVRVPARRCSRSGSRKQQHGLHSPRSPGTPLNT